MAPLNASAGCFVRFIQTTRSMVSNRQQHEAPYFAEQVIIKFLPLMIGWFSLNLPSGLGLYYFANTVLTTAQQIWLRKLGGALSSFTVMWVGMYRCAGWTWETW